MSKNPFTKVQKIAQGGRVDQWKPTAMARDVAGKVDKETFLNELTVSWWNSISKTADSSQEVVKARKRIVDSGYENTFNTVGITDEDLLEVVQYIQKNKPEPCIVERSPGRNTICDCGSGKKYKKCCGK